MPSEKKQMSTWVNDAEAAKIEAAATADSRSVSAWLRLVALEKIAAQETKAA